MAHRLSPLTMRPTPIFPPSALRFSKQRPAKVYPNVPRNGKPFNVCIAGLTFDQIAKAIGRDEVWVAAAFYGQVKIGSSLDRKACSHSIGQILRRRIAKDLGGSRHTLLSGTERVGRALVAKPRVATDAAHRSCYLSAL
jgi:hypothetical protein